MLQKYPEPLIENYIERLKDLQAFHKQHKQITINYLDISLPPYTIKLMYMPFQGHMSRLGHYYRNLFQIVKFVVSQPDTVIVDKKEYLKTLRAQLSSHEQLLLYYNGLSILGRPWITNNYFTDFSMIKNMPVPLADFGILPHDKLGNKNSKGEFIFEWDELVNG